MPRFTGHVFVVVRRTKKVKECHDVVGTGKANRGAENHCIAGFSVATITRREQTRTVRPLPQIMVLVNTGAHLSPLIPTHSLLWGLNLIEKNGGDQFKN